jgi:valyl-tRNA synthetase
LLLCFYRFEARKQIIKDLDEQDLLEKIEPHKLMVPRGDRTNAVIEPYMTDHLRLLVVVLFLTNQQHKSYPFYHTKQGYDAPTKFV